MMTDEQIFELALKHCYATTAANGFIFTRDRGHMIHFARAIERRAFERAAQHCQMEMMFYETLAREGDRSGASDAKADALRGVFVQLGYWAQDPSVTDSPS
jgi:hypothetical protein